MADLVPPSFFTVMATGQLESGDVSLQLRRGSARVQCSGRRSACVLRRAALR
jgi:hypothetical protein